MISNTLMKRS